MKTPRTRRDFLADVGRGMLIAGVGISSALLLFVFLRYTKLGWAVRAASQDRDAAIAVLRAAVDLGIRHIDTADFYGPRVTNELIREALAPYPGDLHIVTKVGARRDSRGGWLHARTPAELRRFSPADLAVQDLSLEDIFIALLPSDEEV